jgi:hypothetical protein
MTARQEIVQGVGEGFQSDSDAEDHSVSNPTSKDLVFNTFLLCYCVKEPVHICRIPCVLVEKT